MRMPFGKYKDELLDNIPTDYLEWLQENVALRIPLSREVGRVLMVRERRPAPVLPDEGKIKQAYRFMALKYHPDRGGSHDAMRAINEFYALLSEGTK